MSGKRASADQCRDNAVDRRTACDEPCEQQRAQNSVAAPLHAIVANRSTRTVTVKALNQARWLLREPDWVVADFLEAGKLVELEPPWPRMRRHFYIVMHERKQRSPGLRHFLDYTRAARSPTGRA